MKQLIITRNYLEFSDYLLNHDDKVRHDFHRIVDPVELRGLDQGLTIIMTGTPEHWQWSEIHMFQTIVRNRSYKIVNPNRN